MKLLERPLSALPGIITGRVFLAAHPTVDHTRLLLTRPQQTSRRQDTGFVHCEGRAVRPTKLSS